MRVLFILFIAVWLNAKSFIISNIPIPSTTVLNLSFQEYTPSEIEDLYENGYILSLLALPNLNDGMQELLQLHRQILHIKQDSNKKLYKIAFFMPQKAIGRYATSTVNSSLTTLLSHNLDFEIKVFDTQNFENSLKKIEKTNYDVVVAPMTRPFAQKLCQSSLSNRYYIPTLHAKTIDCNNSSIIFGAIDYEKQVASFEKLIKEPVTLVSNNSSVTSRIDTHVKQHYQLREHMLITEAGNLKQSLKQAKQVLHEKVVFLNLPLVSATLFLSQLPLYEIQPKAIYSTQILYNPNILKLTQYNNRKNLLIANSIQKLDEKEIGNANLLRNDLRYDWIDFTTTYGLSKVLNEQIQTDQIEYEVQHVKPLRRSFVIKE